jgi:hypothetical protein
MIITALGSRFIYETLPAGFFVRLPFLGQVSIDRNPSNTALPFSSEKDRGETLGGWGRLRWVLTPWSVLKATREV